MVICNFAVDSGANNLILLFPLVLNMFLVKVFHGYDPLRGMNKDFRILLKGC